MGQSRTVQPPKAVADLLSRLEAGGYEAFLAGGCVRDSLMGHEPEDWDITTNAMPEQVMEVFRGFRIIPTGLKHGTVTVLSGEEPVEITTYRVDGEYSDHRRPDSVSFTGILREDLARRDFTVNAMAWSEGTGIVDCFGGIEDLERGVIRCVGEPQKRFHEDALRILRGARFACTLGFSLDRDTGGAMLRLRELLDKIAPERIFTELRKALTGPGFTDFFLDMPHLLFQIVPELASCAGFDQHNEAHIYNVYEHTLHAVGAAPGDRIVRLALLLHDMGKPSCFAPDKAGTGHFHGHPQVSANLAEAVLLRLRADNATIRRVTELILWHDTMTGPEPRLVRRWLGRLGEEALKQLLEVQTADNKAKNPAFGQQRLHKIGKTRICLDKILEERQCCTLRDLAINGADLLNAGYKPGPELGKELERLLSLVIDGILENDRDALIAASAQCGRQP